MLRSLQQVFFPSCLGLGDVEFTEEKQGILPLVQPELQKNLNINAHQTDGDVSSWNCDSQMNVSESKWWSPWFLVFYIHAFRAYCFIILQ